MTRDEILLLGLIAAFAALCTAHVVLVAGLLSQRPWWRGIVALVVPPLAPYWGIRGGMRRRAALWIACAVAYVAMRVAAR